MKVQDLYVIKLWDSCDKQWIQISKAADYETILKTYQDVTKMGTEYVTCNKGKDHFKIFRLSDRLSIKKVSAKRN